MKKLLSLLMAILMLLSLAACGEKGSGFQQPQNTNGNQQAYKAPTIDELTAAFTNQGFVRDYIESPFPEGEMSEMGLSKATKSAVRSFGKPLGDGTNSYVDFYYFRFANEADAAEAFYAVVESLNSTDNVQLSISTGQHGVRATGDGLGLFKGNQYFISQAGNTLVWATESWDHYDENQCDGQMSAVLSGLGY